MKKQLTLIFACITIITQSGFAQAPQAMNYQSVARNSTGTILANQNIGIQLSVTDGNGGTVLYSETHNTTTNPFGLFTLNVGNGTPVNGTFSGISWATLNPWLQVDMDPTGGTAYINMGTSQLLSVPYALLARDVGNDAVNDADADPTNELQTISKVGSTVTLSDGGGSFDDDVNDADANPGNELQTLSVAGNQLSISSGNAVTLPTGTTYTPGTGINIAGNVISNSGDLSTSNELQTLSLSGSNLTISSGNTLALALSRDASTYQRHGQ